MSDIRKAGITISVHRDLLADARVVREVIAQAQRAAAEYRHASPQRRAEIDELRVEHDRDPEAFLRRVAEAERDWDDHLC